jgi:hypothetical protein
MRGKHTKRPMPQQRSKIMQAADRLHQCWEDFKQAEEEMTKAPDRQHHFEARRDHLYDAIVMLEKQMLHSQAQSSADAYVQVSIARGRLDRIADGHTICENKETIRDLERIMDSLRVWLECRSDFELCPVADLYACPDEGPLGCIGKACIEEAVIQG